MNQPRILCKENGHDKSLRVRKSAAHNCLRTDRSRQRAHAQTFTVVHTFNALNGVLPSSGVTIKAGVLYGTTLCPQYPSNCGAGTVYQLKSHRVELVLYSYFSILGGWTRPDGQSIVWPG